MTRIIAGVAGSHRLRVPRNGTRPTSDRVREAMYSALDARGIIPGSRVLDLYAGSGALGLEAASRGAATVTLVELNRAAAHVTQANVAIILKAVHNNMTIPGSGMNARATHDNASVTSEPKLTVAVQAVQSFLEASSAEFDLVFIDPPYDLGADELTQMLASLVPRLHDESVVVLERSTRTAEPVWPRGLVVERRKDYGETALWWVAPFVG